MDYKFVILVALAVAPPLITVLFPQAVLVTFVFSLSLLLLSLLLCFQLYRVSEGEKKKLMASLSIYISLLLTTFVIASSMFFKEIFQIRWELIAVAILGYLFLLFFGIQKISREIEYLTPQRLLIPVVLFVAILSPVFLVPNFGVLHGSAVVGAITAFIFLSLLSLYFNTETRIYWAGISAAIILQNFTKLSMLLIQDLYAISTFPAIFFNLSIFALFFSIYEIYRRKLHVLSVETIDEERKRFEMLFTKMEELKEAFRLMNQALRHDVLKKLQVISGFVEAYEMTKDVSYYERALSAVKEAAGYIEKIGMLERVLTVEKTDLKPINVAEIVKEVAKNYELPINVKGSCSALADESLEFAIDVMFDNAVKHSGTERIDVLISGIEKECEIRVIDYGVGIPSQIKKELFRERVRFGETAGLGIGLYIVKKLVERYGGKVWVEDTKPKGATFVIRLRTA